LPRPKKVLLIVHSNKETLSQLCFVFHIHGYRTIPCADRELGLRNFDSSVDLVIADFKTATSLDKKGIKFKTMVEEMKDRISRVPILLIASEEDYNSGALCAADAMVLTSCPVADLRERVRVMSARKRGPKKGFHPPHGFKKIETVSMGDS
jgi:two-component system response regulator CpxR